MFLKMKWLQLIVIVHIVDSEASYDHRMNAVIYRVSHKSGAINNTVRLLLVTVVSDDTQ
jgi:hypothetical protein